MFLDQEELFKLTGKRRPSAQGRWLRERHYPFEFNDEGVAVLKSVVVARLGGNVKDEPKLRFQDEATQTQ